MFAFLHVVVVVSFAPIAKFKSYQFIFARFSSCPRFLVILVAAATSTADGDLFLQLAVLLGQAIVFTVQALGLRLHGLLVLLLTVQVGCQLMDAFAQLVEL